MKGLFCFILCLSSVYCVIEYPDYSPALKALTDRIHKSCGIITGATDAEIDSVRQGNVQDPQDDIKRYHVCLWLTSQVMDTDFNVQEKMLSDFLPDNIREVQLPIYINCFAKEREAYLADLNLIDHCWAANQCVRDANPDNWIFL